MLHFAILHPDKFCCQLAEKDKWADRQSTSRPTKSVKYKVLTGVWAIKEKWVLCCVWDWATHTFFHFAHLPLISLIIVTYHLTTMVRLVLYMWKSRYS